MVNSTPNADILEEAIRIVDSARENQITLRLLGGMAVRFRCPSAKLTQLARKYADIDLMGFKKEGRGMNKLFVTLGYTPRDIFNKLHGGDRLIFNDIQHGRRIDIFLDVFEMCHRFDFRERLLLDKYTISLADLLATKLQVVEITEREYRDTISLLRDHEISDSDAPETINGQRIAKLCRDDWGIYKTFTVNLERISNALNLYKLEPGDEEIIRTRIRGLQSRMENTPKSTGWKLRARIGDKKQWYDLPEGDKEIVDSRVTCSTFETFEDSGA